ncbi:MAG: methyltransferase domain-containing protein [Deltaproteobacteria bacterium]|nr:methyltransferase domain-containing protein [Deltaproteobacteria bacterium]
MTDTRSIDAAAVPLVPRFEEHELLPGPIDLRAMLDCAAPVELDIGFGKGRSLVEWAALDRDGTLLGIEIRRGLVERAHERLCRAGARGVRLLRGDFRALAPRLGPDGLVRRCYLHFPDPWWKKRHRKRQVVSAPVAAELVRLLAPGGEVCVQTDVPERAEEFRAALAGAGLDERWWSDGGAEARPFDVRSNREVRCEAAGVPVYRMVYGKPPHEARGPEVRGEGSDP